MFRRFVVLMAAALPVAIAADVRVVEEIAAKVNGDIITRGELEETRREAEQLMRSEGATGPKLADAVKEYAANALRDQIDQLLLVQKGKDLSINVDGDINKFFAEIQVQSKIADPDKFHEWLKQQYGQTYEDLKDKKRRQLLSQRVIGQEVTYRVTIPEPELQKYYDEHKTDFIRKEQVYLSQILISLEGKTPEQIAAAEKKAKDIVAQARKGEKFSDLVRTNSDDPETTQNGGQLPPRQRGMSIAAIEDVIWKAKKGDVTDPIRVGQVIVILKIDERFEAGQPTFEEVKQDIQGILSEPKMEPKVREYLTRLREEAFLEIKDGYLDSGAAPGKDTRWKDVAQLKPQTTTKEEVAARTHQHKKFLVIPIPGTTKKVPPITEPASPAQAAPTDPAKPATSDPATATPIKPSPVKQ